MRRMFVLTFLAYALAAMSAIGGIGLFITKLTGHFQGSWWWVISAGLIFVLSLVGMMLPILLAWRRD
jgi:hypothetical protein